LGKSYYIMLDYLRNYAYINLVVILNPLINMVC
jgi:hypothetical protein